jgi:hypothetical protein
VTIAEELLGQSMLPEQEQWVTMTLLVSLHHYVGMAAAESNNADLAFKHFSKARDVLTAQDKKEWTNERHVPYGQARTLNGLGIAYMMKGDRHIGMQLFLSAAEHRNVQGTDALACCHDATINLGLALVEIRQVDRAASVLGNGLAYYEGLPDEDPQKRLM